MASGSLELHQLHYRGGHINARQGHWEQVIVIIRLPFDFSKESYDHILGASCIELVVEACQVQEEALAPTKGHYIADSHVRMKNKQVIPIVQGRCFLVPQLGQLESQDDQLDRDGFVWSPVLSYPNPGPFDEAVRPEQRTGIHTEALVMALLVPKQRGDMVCFCSFSAVI
jgi:hypothetical protein